MRARPMLRPTFDGDGTGCLLGWRPAHAFLPSRGHAILLLAIKNYMLPFFAQSLIMNGEGLALDARIHTHTHLHQRERHGLHFIRTFPAMKIEKGWTIHRCISALLSGRVCHLWHVVLSSSSTSIIFLPMPPIKCLLITYTTAAAFMPECGECGDRQQTILWSCSIAWYCMQNKLSNGIKWRGNEFVRKAR